MDNNKTYSFEEAYEASLKYFNGDELAARVWVNKYAIQTCNGIHALSSPKQIPQHRNTLRNEQRT